MAYLMIEMINFYGQIIPFTLTIIVNDINRNQFNDFRNNDKKSITCLTTSDRAYILFDRQKDMAIREVSLE